jgi:hypothetical protein
MRDISLKAVQELLGHASLAMTMRYAHLSKDKLQEAVSVLNDLGIDTKLTQKPISAPKLEGADKLTVANPL